jgi:hypothetical protein
MNASIAFRLRNAELIVLSAFGRRAAQIMLSRPPKKLAVPERKPVAPAGIPARRPS